MADAAREYAELVASGSIWALLVDDDDLPENCAGEMVTKHLLTCHTRSDIAIALAGAHRALDRLLARRVLDHMNFDGSLP